MFKTKIDAACQLHQNEAKKLHILRQSTPAEVFNLLRKVADQGDEQESLMITSEVVFQDCTLPKMQEAKI